MLFNPELAPRDMIIDQALAIEKMPLEKRGPWNTVCERIK